MKKRLIDATDLVRRVLEERSKVRLEVVPRYGFGVPVPDQFGQAMVGGIRKALRQIETSPTIDAVEVVRCKNCSNFEQIEGLKTSYNCRIGRGYEIVHKGIRYSLITPDSYCNSAKPREQEVKHDT